MKQTQFTSSHMYTHTSACSEGLALNTISGNYMKSEGLFIVPGFVIWTLSRSLPGSVPAQGLTTNSSAGEGVLNMGMALITLPIQQMWPSASTQHKYTSHDKKNGSNMKSFFHWLAHKYLFKQKLFSHFVKDLLVVFGFHEHSHAHNCFSNSP